MSACFIVRDEEQNLPGALESLRGVADEVVVVDTGSQDRTRALAVEHGAKVADFPWVDDFAAARNASLALATQDWILVIDADERLRPEMGQTLKTFLAQVKQQDGIFVRLCNVDTSGKWVSQTQLLRLVRNHRGFRFEGRIHENIATSITAAGGRLLMSELHVLDHTGYVAEENARKQRPERNRRLLQRALDDNPDDPVALHHLGLEHLVAGEVEQAAPLLRRVTSLFPDTLLGAHSAVYLGQALFQAQRFEETWTLVHPFRNAPRSGVDCRFLEAASALELGDAQLAARLAQQLLLDGSFGEVYVRAAQGEALRALALWAQGERADSLARWEALLRSAPEEVALAQQWVRHLSALHGLQGLKREGLAKVKTPAVAMAVVMRMMALADVTGALELARRLGENPRFGLFVGQMLFAAGRHDEAVERLRPHGAEGAQLLGLCGVLQKQTAWVDEARRLLDAPGEAALQSVADATPSREPSTLNVLRGWMEQCLRMGALRGMMLTASALHPDPRERFAALARVSAAEKLTVQALEFASLAGDHPAALEVMGRLAPDEETRQSALEQRLRHASPPLWVHVERARGLVAQGLGEQAEALRARGRERFPHSEALRP